MEPIQRVIGPSGTLDGVAAVHRLAPVERDEGAPGRDHERRRPRRPAPDPAAAAGRGEDGRPHVDVRA